MEHTQNYNLPQWVKSDRIMMDDFNAAMSSIESGLTAAQSTASAAQTTANAAGAKANVAYTPSNKPYVVGTYTGNGGTQSIHLGFRPSFLIVSGMKETTSTMDELGYVRQSVMTCGGQELDHRVKLTSSGFTVFPQPYESFYYPNYNETGRVYDYIAFR